MCRAGEYLSAAMDGKIRFILPHDVHGSDCRFSYGPFKMCA